MARPSKVTAEQTPSMFEAVEEEMATALILGGKAQEVPPAAGVPLASPAGVLVPRPLRCHIIDPALYGCLMMYMAGYLPEVRRMHAEEQERFKSMIREVTDLSGEIPLHTKLFPGEAKLLTFPSWRNGQQLTGPKTLALMVAALFVAQGEQPEMCSSLCEVWPVREALLMVDGPRLTTEKFAAFDYIGE